MKGAKHSNHGLHKPSNTGLWIAALVLGALIVASVFTYYYSVVPLLSPEAIPGVPTDICTLTELNNIRSNLGGNYRLVCNIDFAASTSGRFDPIAGSFTGLFDGNGFELSNWGVNMPSDSNVGFFKILDGGTLRNVRLVNVNVGAGNTAGALVGTVNSGTIDNSYVSGSISGTGNLGGLVGSAVTTGGVVTISDSVADVDVTSSSGDNVGGFIGYSEGAVTVTNSASYGQVVGVSDVGGFVGEINDGHITTARAVGDVTGDFRTGGFVGKVSEKTNYNSQTIIDNSQAEGDVDVSAGSSQYAIGGFAGTVEGIDTGNGIIIDLSSSSGSVTSISSTSGGNDPPAVGKCIGGFVGQVYGMSGNSANPNPVVRQSYSTGNVVGENFVGGFAGTLAQTSECISTSPSNPSCDVEPCQIIVTVFDSYSRGSVSGTSSVGGFIGGLSTPSSSVIEFKANVFNSYSRGSVSGTSSVGGFIGLALTKEITVISSYWDTQTSGQATSNAGAGKTTAEMKQQATFSNWNFASIWNILENQKYPWIRNALSVSVLSPQVQTYNTNSVQLIARTNRKGTCVYTLSGPSPGSGSITNDLTLTYTTQLNSLANGAYTVALNCEDTEGNAASSPAVSFSVDVTSNPVCGNGVVETGEDCDPSGSMRSCTLNGVSGTQACSSTCTWNACQVGSSSTSSSTSSTSSSSSSSSSSSGGGGGGGGASTTHLACVNNACAYVSGPGTNAPGCTAIGNSCGNTPQTVTESTQTEETSQEAETQQRRRTIVSTLTVILSVILIASVIGLVTVLFVIRRRKEAYNSILQQLQRGKEKIVNSPTKSNDRSNIKI